MIYIVLHHPGSLGDPQKRYRFTPQVSKWRIPDGVSVDALYDFGAKNFYRCTEIIQLGLIVECGRIITFRSFRRFLCDRWFCNGAFQRKMSHVGACIRQIQGDRADPVNGSS
ncbi:hypothetical protein EMIT0P253_280066 [Pseudomonas sp. IT-P253]